MMTIPGQPIPGHLPNLMTTPQHCTECSTQLGQNAYGSQGVDGAFCSEACLDKHLAAQMPTPILSAMVRCPVSTHMEQVRAQDLAARTGIYTCAACSRQHRLVLP